VVHVESHAHDPEGVKLFGHITPLDQTRHMNRVKAVDSKFRQLSLSGANTLERGFGVGVD
jgi:hypothetical protein